MFNRKRGAPAVGGKVTTLTKKPRPVPSDPPYPTDPYPPFEDWPH
jgi:hypothetical protein